MVSSFRFCLPIPNVYIHTQIFKIYSLTQRCYHMWFVNWSKKYRWLNEINVSIELFIWSTHYIFFNLQKKFHNFMASVNASRKYVYVCMYLVQWYTNTTVNLKFREGGLSKNREGNWSAICSRIMFLQPLRLLYIRIFNNLKQI